MCAHQSGLLLIKALTVSVLELLGLGTWKGYNRKKDPVESKTRMPLGPQVPMNHMKVLQPQYMGYKMKDT